MADRIKNVKLRESVQKQLDKLKVHPRESYEQLIRRIVLGEKIK